MNKKEQIEELARDIEKSLERAKSVVGSMNKGIGYWIAEDLVDKNYRKVNENEVVMLEEENKRLREMPEKVYAEMTERLRAELQRYADEHNEPIDWKRGGIMSKEEQIKEMAKDIMSGEFFDYGIVCKKHTCQLDCDCGGYRIAEELANKGYHKTIWHKVADGDIPKRIGDIIMAIKFDGSIITTTGRYRLYDFYISDIGRIEKEKVIAWTEPPEYKEVEE